MVFPSMQCGGIFVASFKLSCMYHMQASYGVEDAQFAVVQLAQTTMRSELGKIRLDSVFQERMNLNLMIVGELFLLHLKSMAVYHKL